MLLNKRKLEMIFIRCSTLLILIFIRSTVSNADNSTDASNSTSIHDIDLDKRFLSFHDVLSFLKDLLFESRSDENRRSALNDHKSDNVDSPQCKNGRIQCDPKSRYRTIDGSCNNLRHPSWGAALTPFSRYLPPYYADGVHKPPMTASGRPLPNARLLSTECFPIKNENDKKYSLAFMQFGQLMVHDMSLSLDSLFNPQGPACCDPKTGPKDMLSKGEPCMTVLMPENDPVRVKYGQTCMAFVRSSTDQYTGCPFGKGRDAKPLSSTSHWMDASIIYGDDNARTAKLREHKGGRLKVEYRNGQSWPTQNYHPTFECNEAPPAQKCYLTGDGRVNHNPELAVLEISFFRDHNRMATILGKLNPHWNDEKLFQESRRILVAIFQHISYYEWLPWLLGPKRAEESGLIYPNEEGYVNDYNSTADPSVSNEHAHAAFRFPHTNIRGMLELMNENREKTSSFWMYPHMMNVTIIEQDGIFGGLTRGVATQPQHASGVFTSRSVKEDLFRVPDFPNSAADLRSLDILRARDHGLPPYNAYRQFCGLKKAKKFEDFSDHISQDNIAKLRKFYEKVDDVELSIGGGLEKRVKGSQTGFTFTCIIKRQFHNTRVADRFFFERGDHDAAFTPAQLSEIRKSSLARILCDNSFHVRTMQPQAFLLPSSKNSVVPCEDIPAVDLRAWEETSAT